MKRLSCALASASGRFGCHAAVALPRSAVSARQLTTRRIENRQPKTRGLAGKGYPLREAARQLVRGVTTLGKWIIPQKRNEL